MVLVFIFKGILPTACTASTWKIAPYSLTLTPISSMGKIVPVSLLAYITVTKAVLPVKEASNSFKSICP